MTQSKNNLDRETESYNKLFARQSETAENTVKIMKTTLSKRVYKLNTNNAHLPDCCALLVASMRCQHERAHTTNDLSLTKRFLMHIFYFPSCNYDKLLNSQWHRKLVNGCAAVAAFAVYLHLETISRHHNGEWNENQPEKKKIESENCFNLRHEKKSTQ